MKRNKNRKEEIYAVASALFQEKGYASASVRDIAELVGLEPSSLYNHIKSKEEILINICSTFADQFKKGMEAISTAPISYKEKLSMLIDLHIDIAYNHPSSMTVFNDEWRYLPKKDLALFLHDRQDYEESFKHILRAGMDTGEFIEMSETTAFHMIINSVKWLHYQSKKTSSEKLLIKRNEVFTFISRGFFRSVV